MELSTKTRYTVRALIELSINYGEGPLMLKKVARRQDIPEKYLEQLMTPLRVQGIVYTIRGNRGGYVLARPPEELTLYEVVTSVTGSVAPVPCVEKEDFCQRSEICAAREAWCEVYQSIVSTLQDYTMAQLAQRQLHKAPQEDQPTDYTI